MNQLSIKNTTPNVGTAWPEFLLRSKALIFFEILFVYSKRDFKEVTKVCVLWEKDLSNFQTRLRAEVIIQRSAAIPRYDNKRVESNVLLRCHKKPSDFALGRTKLFSIETPVHAHMKTVISELTSLPIAKRNFEIPVCFLGPTR